MNTAFFRPGWIQQFNSYCEDSVSLSPSLSSVFSGWRFVGAGFLCMVSTGSSGIFYQLKSSRNAVSHSFSKSHRVDVGAMTSQAWEMEHGGDSAAPSEPSEGALEVSQSKAEAPLLTEEEATLSCNIDQAYSEICHHLTSLDIDIHIQKRKGLHQIAPKSFKKKRKKRKSL